MIDLARPVAMAGCVIAGSAVSAMLTGCGGFQVAGSPHGCRRLQRSALAVCANPTIDPARRF